jgi:hypothetical protein
MPICKPNSRVQKEGRRLLRQIKSNRRLSRIVDHIYIGLLKEVDPWAKSRAKFCILVKTHRTKPGHSRLFPEKMGSYLVYVPASKDVLANTQSLQYLIYIPTPALQ